MPYSLEADKQEPNQPKNQDSNISIHIFQLIIVHSA